VSVWVQAFPSVHAVPFASAGFEQVPLAGSQVPTPWHWSLAVQAAGLDPLHVPDWHVSVCVQASPSLQVVPFASAGFEQAPVLGLHVPAPWHWSCAAHVTTFDPLQVPDWQVSVCVQALPSLHAVPFARFTSAGQDAVVPLQLSAASHWPAAGRHTVVEGWNASAGQAADVPVQVSATSQAPADARQSVPAATIESAGQAADVPLQVSGTSHRPADPRQMVPLFTGEQVPTWPGKLQAPQAPVQAVSQQTPLTQKPVTHWLFEVQLRPNEPS